MIILFLSFALMGGVAGQQTAAPSPSPVQQENVKAQPLNSSEISQLRVKAQAGDAHAQSALGKAYWTGDGVSRSDEAAAIWFRKAADQGDADAENALGTLYLMGEGVAKDKNEALLWYHKAAKGGSAGAMFNLGAAYYNGDLVGDLVKADDVTSCAWFLLAQEAGYPQADDAVRRAASESPSRPIQAAAKIGEMYLKGGELPKNPSKALRWYRIAADGGVYEAAVNAAALLIGGADPTPDEYGEARKRCEDAAKHDYGPAAYCLAVIYRRGLGVTQDPTESAKWLIRAANLGYPKAMLQLGEAYWKGDGVKPNLITAYTWVWMAYTFQAIGAQQDEEALRKQMDPRDIEKAKRNAEKSPAQRQVLVLHNKSPEPSSQ